ncbi:MAG: DNA gyrase subunit A [Nitrososphaeraceae archaeon]
MKNMDSSEYINKERKAYALYIMQQRSIPSIADGLKAGGRRVLWTARNGDKVKTATLSGLAMSLHPHSAPDGAINTLAAPYGNNIPLFEGFGAFGTLLEPTEYGASRYTSVKVSKFSKDVLFKDIEIVPMMENYDSTELEPVHFLPLIPMVLLNPSEGIALGFASNILPRSLDDIINVQLNYLKKNKTTGELNPKFAPINNFSSHSVMTDKGLAYYFSGEFEMINANSIVITKIPYSQTHEKVINKLDNEIEKGNIIDYTDKSKDKIEIIVKFKRGILSELSNDEILNIIGLTVRSFENLNVLDFNGTAILNTTPMDLVYRFTDWRLEFYIKRYERLRNLILADIQKYLDIRMAIKNNIGGVAKKVQSRTELKTLITNLKIINVDFIADLPVYKFTEEEYNKNEERLKEAEALLEYYNDLLSSDDKRRKIYISELQEILTKYNKGYYTK